MTAFSIAQGVAKAVGRGLTAPGSGGGGPLPIPAGFDWTPPVSVFRSSDGVYSTDYDPTPFLVEGDPGVTTFYVDGDTGSDANPGTAVSPKKSLVPISGGRVNKLLIKARGTFYGGYTSPVQVGHDELCVEAWDGAYCAITTLPSPTAPFVWTDEGGGVWSAPPMFSGFNGINPYAGTDIETLQKYPLAASLAACQATPGTHFRETVPSIKHYVHTLDGTRPGDRYTRFLGNVIAAQSFSTAAFAFNQRLAFHGITFMGGPTAFNVLGTTALQKRVDFRELRIQATPEVSALCKPPATLWSSPTSPAPGRLCLTALATRPHLVRQEPKSPAPSKSTAPATTTVSSIPAQTKAAPRTSAASCCA